jgi:hypothetical protein
VAFVLAQVVAARRPSVVVLATADRAVDVDRVPAPNLETAEDTLVAGGSSVEGNFVEDSRGHVDSEDSPAADLGLDM